jgi:hypothetical protein
MFCPNCGVQLQKDASFCNQCGASVIFDQMHLAPQPVPSQMVCYEKKKEVDVLSLVLSILGLVSVLIFYVAPIALGLAIAGLVIARRRSATKNVTAATVMGIVGIVISALELVLLVLIAIVARTAYYWY